jgi:hypothetical protein
VFDHASVIKCMQSPFIIPSSGMQHRSERIPFRCYAIHFLIFFSGGKSLLAMNAILSLILRQKCVIGADFFLLQKALRTINFQIVLSFKCSYIFAQHIIEQTR